MVGGVLEGGGREVKSISLVVMPNAAVAHYMNRRTEKKKHFDLCTYSFVSVSWRNGELKKSEFGFSAADWMLLKI